MMQIEIFTLCEYAATVQDKLTIVNAFTTFYTPDVPAECYHCYLALRVRFEDADVGTHTFDTRIIDGDGQRLTRDLVFQKNLPPLDVKTHVWTHLFDIRGLRFQRFGDHWIDLVVDGTLTHRVPLFVCPAE